MSRAIVRFVVALAVGGALSVLVWVTYHPRLEPPIDIVGYPTFANYNFRPGFLAYRLVVWVLPAITTLALALLWTWGPLRAPRPGHRPAPSVAARDHGVPSERSWWTLGWLLPSAAGLAVAVSAHGAAPSDTVGAAGLAAGVAVVVATVLLGAVVAAGRGLGAQAGAVGPGGLLESVRLVQGPVAAAVAMAALCLYIRSTATVAPDGRVDHWPILPVWLCVVLVAAAAVVPLLSRIGSRPPRAEQALVGAFAGAALISMTTTFLVGPLGPIAGFDDMQSVTGADLIGRGYFPWRDVLFVHGPFEDALRSMVGFALFEPTIWGSVAAGGVIWVPLGWVSLFVLGAWAAEGRGLPTLVVLVAVSYASTQAAVSLRFCIAPLVFVLLGEALRRGRVRWVVAMTAVLFAEAVLVPEAAFQVLAVAAVVVLHDLTSRQPGQGLRTAFRTTITFVVSGSLLSLVWAGFLAFHSSLGPFIDYYVIFGPGHVEAGALPFLKFAEDRFVVMMGAGTVLVALTLVVAGWWWLARRPVRHEHWVMLGCALMGGLYGEKALGRFDNGHLLQSFFVFLFLGILWLARGLVWAEDTLEQRVRAKVRAAVVPGAYAVVLTLAVVCLPPLREEVWHAPSSNKSAVWGASLPDVGYAGDGVYDPDLLKDLRTVADTYGAGADGFFDFTNSPGWYYYLLGIDPMTRYFHVSMAIPEGAQQDLVDQLQEDPPALVAFDGPIGLPAWDGVSNEVRHFEVSRFLLSGWTPVLRTHGVLFLLRNDLLSDAPPLPNLTEPPDIDHLYSPDEPCTWGSAAAFLSTPVGTGATVDVAPRPVRRISVRGWSTGATSGVPRRVLVAVGSSVISTFPLDVPRPDVVAADGEPDPGASGFDGQTVTVESGPIRLFVEEADARARALGSREGPAEVLRLPDGSNVAVVAGKPAAGAIDSLSVTKVRMATIAVPPGMSLPDVRAAEFETNGRPLGRGEFVLTDSLSGLRGLDRTIRFRTLPSTGERVAVRVGSCLQWHGFTGDQLYLFQRHGQDVRRVRFATDE